MLRLLKSEDVLPIRLHDDNRAGVSIGFIQEGLIESARLFVAPAPYRFCIVV
jgi:hypothetical protein